MNDDKVLFLAVVVLLFAVAGLIGYIMYVLRKRRTGTVVSIAPENLPPP